jgi:mRNA interferase MazF
MTRFERSEVVLVVFPFSSGVGAKQRPALVLLDDGDEDILVARITTQLPGSSCELAIEDWKESGLLAASSVRLHKLATIEKRLVRRSLGCLSKRDWAAARATLAKLL